MIAAAPDGSHAFEIVSRDVDEDSPPVVMVTGMRVGTVLPDWRPPNPFHSYASPQLVASVRVHDRAADTLRCGFAVLEPVATGESLHFGGLRELHLADAPSEPRSCGRLVELMDRQLGTGEGEGLDGRDELTMEMTVVELRGEGESRRQERWELAWTTAGPLLVEESVRDHSEAAGAPFAWLELSGTDEIEVRTGPWQEPEAELPPLLASLAARHASFAPERVRRDGREVAFEFEAEDSRQIGRLLRDLEDSPTTDRVTVGFSFGEGGRRLVKVRYLEVEPGG